MWWILLIILIILIAIGVWYFYPEIKTFLGGFPRDLESEFVKIAAPVPLWYNKNLKSEKFIQSNAVTDFDGIAYETMGVPIMKIPLDDGSEAAKKNREWLGYGDDDTEQVKMKLKKRPLVMEDSGGKYYIDREYVGRGQVVIDNGSDDDIDDTAASISSDIGSHSGGRGSGGSRGSSSRSSSSSRGSRSASRAATAAVLSHATRSNGSRVNRSVTNGDRVTTQTVGPKNYSSPWYSAKGYEHSLLAAEHRQLLSDTVEKTKKGYKVYFDRWYYYARKSNVWRMMDKDHNPTEDAHQRFVLDYFLWKRCWEHMSAISTVDTEAYAEMKALVKTTPTLEDIKSKYHTNLDQIYNEVKQAMQKSLKIGEKFKDPLVRNYFVKITYKIADTVRKELKDAGLM